MLASDLISWSYKRQKFVALSIYKAEYIAICEIGKEAIWIRCLLLKFNYIIKNPTILYANNQGAIALAENPEFYRRIKYIDVKYY